MFLGQKIKKQQAKKANIKILARAGNPTRELSHLRFVISRPL